jgi:cytochrome c
MSRFRELALAGVGVFLLVPGGSIAGDVSGLGRPATDAEIRAWDIDIRPDGTGLPKGRGTVAEGEPIYTDYCASCHGDFGEGLDRWPVLAGGQDTLTDDRPVKTIGSYWPYLSTVFDYVRRAMPFGNARSLTDDEVYALTAYLLHLNDVVLDEDFELSKDNFTEVTLPNEDSFVDDGRLEEDHYARAAEPCMSDCMPSPAKVSMHARVLDVTPEGEEDGAGAVD